MFNDIFINFDISSINVIVAPSVSKMKIDFTDHTVLFASAFSSFSFSHSHQFSVFSLLSEERSAKKPSASFSLIFISLLYSLGSFERHVRCLLTTDSVPERCKRYAAFRALGNNVDRAVGALRHLGDVSDALYITVIRD